MNTTRTDLPIAARAWPFHEPSLLARFERLGFGVTGITRTYNRLTGDVDLVFRWIDDEARHDHHQRALRVAHEHLIDSGFHVAFAGAGYDCHIRLKPGYFGTKRALEEAAAEASPRPLAKVVPISAAAGRRAS